MMIVRSRWILAPAFALSLACSSLIGQSPATKSPTARPWVRDTPLGWRFGADSIRAGAPMPWDSARRSPILVAALIAIAEDSTWLGLGRNNAILRLGGTGQYPAYTYLASAFDSMAPGSILRLDAILAMGNGYPDRPPEFIYQRLQSVLYKGLPTEREMAAMALGDIMSPRALSILRSRLPLEESRGVAGKIKWGLNKTQKP